MNFGFASKVLEIVLEDESISDIHSLTYTYTHHSGMTQLSRLLGCGANAI